VRVHAHGELHAEAERQRQRRVLAAVLREPALASSGGLLLLRRGARIYAPEPLTAACVAQLAHDNLLWDRTGAEGLGTRGAEEDASVLAAVSLQHFLDEHCGGWANTFG
jgi:hypothetical protein